MKPIKLMRAFSLTLLVMGISVSPIFAQRVNQKTQTYPDTLSTFYIGVQGGYIFKNNDLAQDPAYYLSHGYFAELNGGWRSSNNWFGWQLNLGRLNLNRDLPYEGGAAFGLNGYDVLQASSPNWMWKNAVRDDRAFIFPKSSIRTFKKTNLQSWYALTGPKFWFGKNRLQGFVGLNAGVGYTTFGYYLINGAAEKSSKLKYDYYSKPNNTIAGQASVFLRQTSYSQYGGTKKAMSGLPNVNDEAKINLMARGSIGLEYFLSPKISINASASYWYLMVPAWDAEVQAKGLISGKIPKTAGLSNPDPHLIVGSSGNGRIVKLPFRYQKSFDNQNPRFISASIGVKYWFGKKSEPVVEEQPQQKIQTKELLITVKDKPTGYALSGVKVTVYKNGRSFYSGFTDVNGAVAAIKNLRPGKYKIQGILNGIKTTVAYIDKSDFKGPARVIDCLLLHNDPRFTLVGHTLNAKTDAKMPHIKTVLTQSKGGENMTQVSNSDGEFRYQLKPNSDFTVIAKQKGYFSNREKVSTKGLDRSKTLYVNLRLSVVQLKQGASFELKNIYYDFDKYNIRPDAAKVLNDVYMMMVDNPTLVIELSSYTDSRGSDSYNVKLSQERASSAVQYLVNKGIDSSRLVAKGYGETNPLNGCVNGVPCTEEQYQANRRTEIKVLKN